MMADESLIPWIRVHTSPTLKEIEADWLSLLGDATRQEGDYQQFLRNHSGFLFPRYSVWGTLVVSELRLGSDHRVDFLVADSHGSYGFVYQLIEIESPHTPAYTKSGNPSARLTHAMQQIRDWKSWIADNSQEALRVFPSAFHRLRGWQNYEHLVIIGKRGDHGSTFDAKRNQLAKDAGISIRSFDWFTDSLKNNYFMSLSSMPSSGSRKISFENSNLISNPFEVAYSDVDWRRLIAGDGFSDYHMIGNNIEAVLELRKYNSDRLAGFKVYLDTLPEEERVLQHWEYNMR